MHKVDLLGEQICTTYGRHVVSHLVIALLCLRTCHLTSNKNICVGWAGGVCESALGLLHTKLKIRVSLFHPCWERVNQGKLLVTMRYVAHPSLELLQNWHLGILEGEKK